MAPAPLHVLDPNGDLVDVWTAEPSIRTIARGLSRLRRFGAAAKRTVTVADHSVLVSEIAQERAARIGMSDASVRKVALQGLLHDAQEALVGDIISPLRCITPQLNSLEKHLQERLYHRAGLPLQQHACVAWADRKALFIEAHHVVRGRGRNWAGYAEACPTQEEKRMFRGLGRKASEALFLERFFALADRTEL